MKADLATQFGNIDIYLFDQLLKGTYADCKHILDVGCGGGRNLVYFLNQGCEVYGIDPDAECIAFVRELSKSLLPRNPIANFKVAYAEQLPFQDSQFDLVISSAVLHFARNAEHFDAMLFSMWRVIKPGGFFFARLATNIGIEDKVKPLGLGRYLLPDESERFLCNEEMLLDYTTKLNGILYEPIKTTNVQNMRCMTTWCLRKNF
ncbi:tellurite methyltransferase [Pedobacter sp. UYP30]|uniref:class I SAM-dependent methyltransferase n=1 Tax=Pedobacter sp. UYP30 TaxID=1756400 RepID=UPI003395439B